MFDLMRKMMLVSIGALTLTRDKAEHLVKELSDRGQVSSSEAKAFVQELIEKGDKERQEVEKAIAVELGKVRDEWGLVTKKDIADINGRLARIEGRLFGSTVEPAATAGKDDPGAAPEVVQS